MSLFTLVITFSRFNNNSNSAYENPFEWLLLYLGEGFLRFNQIAWNNDFLMWGDNNFASIKSLIGNFSFESRLDCTNYYDMKIGSQIETFYTYIGDFVLDYGIYFSILIYIGLHWLFKKYFKIKGILTFESIPLMLAILKMLLTGFTATIYRGGISMLIIAILYLIIGRMLRKQYKKRIT